MVWYACYGSNMDFDRFLKYIKGGQLIVNGATKVYKACPTDTLPPRQSESYSINRRFFFAKESTTWNKQGVAFISNKKNKKSKTFGKLYLISKDQFSHLFAQENQRNVVEIDYAMLLRNDFLDFDYNFYNRIVILNKNYKGYPILTFTNKSTLPTNKPHFKYAQLIIYGLKQTHNLTSKEAISYLSKRGTGAKKIDLKES
ncbi:MAG: hypothetical protein BGP13_17300 [Sphingobacteriales bacterium 40-81]|nr:MAG: hypothetical protein BGP13_17300 [Sphingobacteriales bacterium 40-81]